MKTTILSADDLRQIVKRVGIDTLMDETIQRLNSTFAGYDPGETLIPTRGGFKYSHPQLGLIEWMPGMRVGEGAYIKVVGYHPDSGALHGLPTILSTQSLYSVRDGRLLSLMDASFATALRTGAASAVASQVLARPDADALGLIGSGAQAVTQLHALSRVFEIKEVFLFDTNADAMRSFAARIAPLGLEHIRLHAGPVAEWLHKVDILVTATSVGIGDGPVFHDLDVPAQLHINAIGSDFPGKFEVPKTVLARALVCPDFPEQAAAEGECQRVMPEDIGPDIATLVKDPQRYAAERDRITVFDSTGWALEDMVTTDLFRDYARRFGLGHELQLETISSDHLDPYQFLRETGEPAQPLRSAGNA